MMKQVLSSREVEAIDAYWRAANYLCVGMLYLRDNPLLRKPLRPEHIKRRQLGHWGTDPGQSLVWAHLNRLIKKLDLNVLYVSGPGHGAPATLANSYLEGVYSEVYPDRSQDEDGMCEFFRMFSSPGGVGSHCTPETPGSIHEGGELGYSLSHAAGAAFDNPDLIVAAVVGDGESETGPLATSWHFNKFLNPVRDGAVLPILHLNGYKIANPTILARIPPEELHSLMVGYGYTPHVVEGDDPKIVHQAIAAALEACIASIHKIQKQARAKSAAERQPRPRWPMIILRTPKGWTDPKKLDGHKLEGSWRSHQVPIPDVIENRKHLKLLEKWMRSYHPEKLFDKSGALIPELKQLAPSGDRRISANPHSNPGLLRRPLKLPNFRNYAIKVAKPARTYGESTYVLGEFLRDVMRDNPNNFRVFGPDETASNRLQAIYQASKKTWLEEYKPEDADGGELAPDGRVMEMLSEHTLEGWLEGYVLTGRHGMFATYEAFAHVIDSMFNQHAKWLEKCREVPWRDPLPSLNILISSTVWRQDHNGFTHQDPGFIDVVTNKSAWITRVYLPPDANCLLSVADHCLRSTNYVNVIVADKQAHPEFLDIQSAVNHCTKGIGIWDFACTDQGAEPDVVMASAGDVATIESLAAAAILRKKFPDLKLRFVNVVDLFKLQPSTQHPHGLTDPDFDGLFTADKPVIFNFHGYPWLIHKLAYKRHNHDNMHVRGYKEAGSINTPLQLAINNQTDRFNLAIDVIDRVPRLEKIGGAHVKDWLKDQITESMDCATENGIDRDEITNWKWPY
jgi:xylulose-5-phosphate/fructose-6-phosphate phosphoketolase